LYSQYAKRGMASKIRQMKEGLEAQEREARGRDGAPSEARVSTGVFVICSWV